MSYSQSFNKIGLLVIDLINKGSGFDPIIHTDGDFKI